MLNFRVKNFFEPKMDQFQPYLQLPKPKIKKPIARAQWNQIPKMGQIICFYVNSQNVGLRPTFSRPSGVHLPKCPSRKTLKINLNIHVSWEFHWQENVLIQKSYNFFQRCLIMLLPTQSLVRKRCPFIQVYYKQLVVTFCFRQRVSKFVSDRESVILFQTESHFFFVSDRESLLFSSVK